MIVCGQTNWTADASEACSKHCPACPVHSAMLQIAKSIFSSSMVSYVDSQAAKSVDAALVAAGYHMEELIVMAAECVARAILHFYPPAAYPRPLVFAGPGNNGADAIMAARFLKTFGYAPTVVVLSGSSKVDRYIPACRGFEIEVLANADEALGSSCSLIVDGIFGFGFSGELTGIYKETIEGFKSSSCPIVSIDVPSGWPVDQGTGVQYRVSVLLEYNSALDLFVPDLLVSLSAPKICSRGFAGRHVLSGHFVPRGVADQLGLSLPVYGSAFFVAVGSDKVQC